MYSKSRKCVQGTVKWAYDQAVRCAPCHGKVFEIMWTEYCRQRAYPEDLLNRVHALAEHVHAQLLKSGTGDAGVEVHSLKQAVNLDGGLC
jgi:hypothetical protein